MSDVPQDADPAYGPKDASRGAPLLAPEAALELVVNGRRLATLMCTPIDIDELALGFLLSRGLIAEAGDVVSLSICPDRSRVRVEIRGDHPDGANSDGEFIPSGCGSGAVPLASAFPAIESDWSIDLDRLASWARGMFSSAELYRLSGGMHCAALAREGDKTPFVVREDVGRHNAVDKVIGRGMLAGVDFSSSCLLTSGRIAADMALKGLAAGIPVLVTRSVPTTAAFEIARSRGLTLVGRIGSAAPGIYTGPERIRRKATGLESPTNAP
jgi:FdhD protein